MRLPPSEPDRSLSVVLPCHDPSSDELASIVLCLRGLRKGPLLELLVVEQLEANRRGATPLQDAVAAQADPRVKHVAVPLDTRSFHRTRLCNEAALRTRGDYLWLHDPHLIVPFVEIANTLARTDADVIKPFGSYVKLSKHDTRAFRQGGSLGDPIIQHGKQLGEAFGKASLVLDREVFLALRGMQERLVGPADEGFELVRRCKKYFRHLETFEAHRGAWLHRAPRRDDADLAEHNKCLRAKMGEAIDRDVEAYLHAELVSCLPHDAGVLRRLVVERERRRAVAPTRPTPPPKRPVQLPGSLWGLTTYFNPAGYESKRRNYQRFQQACRAQGLPLLTVELAFEDRPFELTLEDADRLVQLRSSAVLWHKERLLALGLEHLPPGCDKVAWLDADILFENPDWVAQTAGALDRYVMVQPFTMSVRLDKGEEWIDLAGLPIGSGDHEVLPGMAFGVSQKGYGCLGRYLDHGHSGYAWAGRRDVLQRCGFYEANILGNGDLNMALAMFGGADYVSKTRFSDKARKHLQAWASRLYQEVQGSVGWVDGTVHHLWHGNKRDRLYDVRLTVLKDHDFDPDNDLGYDENGVLCWRVDKPGLRDWCKRYFDMRKEA